MTCDHPQSQSHSKKKQFHTTEKKGGAEGGPSAVIVSCNCNCNTRYGAVLKQYRHVVQRGVGVQRGGEPRKHLFSPPVGWRVYSPLMCLSVCPSVTTERLSKLRKITGKKQALFPLGPLWPPVTGSKNLHSS